jgi:hypothetical protein
MERGGGVVVTARPISEVKPEFGTDGRQWLAGYAPCDEKGGGAWRYHGRHKEREEMQKQCKAVYQRKALRQRGSSTH